MANRQRGYGKRKTAHLSKAAKLRGGLWGDVRGCAPCGNQKRFAPSFRRVSWKICELRKKATLCFENGFAVFVLQSSPLCLAETAQRRCDVCFFISVLFFTLCLGALFRSTEVFSNCSHNFQSFSIFVCITTIFPLYCSSAFLRPFKSLFVFVFVLPSHRCDAFPLLFIIGF